MQITPDLTSVMPASAGEAAYRAFQWSKNYFGLAHKLTSTRATAAWASLLQAVQGQAQAASQASKPLSQATLDAAQTRYDALLTLDWQDAEAGYYPHSLLFQNDWNDFARFYPQVWLDLVSIGDRVVNKRYREFAADIDTDGYPKYYLQNFHHQTDGYLSDRSADLYDLQVDLLFGGCTDAMRRRIIPSIIEHASKRPDKSTRILDVACGTGRTLRQLRRAFPKSSLHGIDLSPAYLRKANQMLSAIPGELPQLVQHNAESMPFADGCFDIVTSVFLFHELPARARQNVIDEMARVAVPNGLLAICDSIQIDDAPELMESMEGFSRTFHEPYYTNYIRDNLGDRLQAAGCEVLDVQSHFLSRYTIARKVA